jgi:hypothetical protein
MRIDRSHPQDGNPNAASAESSQWDPKRGHEPRATPVETQAQKLLEQAGSPELAQQIVDSAAVTVPHGSPQDEFARSLGFASYLSLFEDSTALSADREKQWFVTAVQRGQWILWNDVDLEEFGRFPTRVAAERAVAASRSP